MKNHLFKKQIKDQSINFEKKATAVSLVSIIGNTILSVFKLFAGIIAHSAAMISDAFHSASDIFSSIIVIIGIKLSAKESDKDHPYGHERFECVAAIILAIILFLTGIFIGYSEIIHLSDDSAPNTVPGLLALITAIVSILAKEAMFIYTKYYARNLNSDALMADAWHHRSDALSSIGSFIGILGSRLGYHKADTLAAIVIALFILKASYDIFKDAISKMTDKSADEEIENEIKSCILSQDGVLQIDMLRTRVFGNRLYVEIEISADADISFIQSHEIAENVHKAVEESFPVIKHITVHVTPL